MCAVMIAGRKISEVRVQRLLAQNGISAEDEGLWSVLLQFLALFFLSLQEYRRNQAPRRVLQVSPPSAQKKVWCVIGWLLMGCRDMLKTWQQKQR